MDKCALCDSPIGRDVLSDDRDTLSYRCLVCGSVRITEEAVIGKANTIGKRAYLLSGIMRSLSELSQPPVLIASDNIDKIISSSNTPKNVSQQLDLILLYSERHSTYAGQPVTLVVDRNYPIAFAKNFNEFRYFIDQLEAQKLIEVYPDRKNVILTIDGYTRLDAIHRTRPTSRQVFVAMWFTGELQNAFDHGFAKAISDCGFSPLRIDLIHHNDKIDDRIVAEIRKSTFLVADFTGSRGGVYFEAGFAMGLGIPVIWTCREDSIKDVHFDTRQYNHIVWKTEQDLYTALRDRIEATITAAA